MCEQDNIIQNEELRDDNNQDVDIDEIIKSEISKIVVPPQITALMDAARNGSPFCEELAEIKEIEEEPE